MNKIAFIKQLREAADELSPLTQSATASSLTWNGTEYANGAENKSPDPYALAWQTVLIAISGLIEAQTSPISENQVIYLERLLFGGVASLNDLYFDPKISGDIAMSINNRLKQQRHVLYRSLKGE